jgi:hypothetical protein
MAVTIIYISGGLGLLTVDWKMSHLLTTYHMACAQWGLVLQCLISQTGSASCKSVTKKYTNITVVSAFVLSVSRFMQGTINLKESNYLQSTYTFMHSNAGVTVYNTPFNIQ